MVCVVATKERSDAHGKKTCQRRRQHGVAYVWLRDETEDGTITKETFLTQKAALTERQSKAAQNKASILKEIAAAQTEKNQFVAQYRKYADLDELTTEIAEELVDRITIYPDARIDILLNYTDELKQFMGE